MSISVVQRNMWLDWHKVKRPLMLISQHRRALTPNTRWLHSDHVNNGIQRLVHLTSQRISL